MFRICNAWYEKHLEIHIEIQNTENFQDMETFQDMEIFLNMEMILDMEVKHDTLYCTAIKRRNFFCHG